MVLLTHGRAKIIVIVYSGESIIGGPASTSKFKI